MTWTVVTTGPYIEMLGIVSPRRQHRVSSDVDRVLYAM